MRTVFGMLGLAIVLCLGMNVEAQPPGGGQGGQKVQKGGPQGKGQQGQGGKQGGGQGQMDSTAMVQKIMAFDKNGDGKLTRDEVTDQRLISLLTRADTNADGSVTKEELTTLFQNESQGNMGGGKGGQGKGGPGGQGKGGPGGQGKGGPGGGQGKGR
jgi:hypothetical protein